MSFSSRTLSTLSRATATLLALSGTNALAASTWSSQGNWDSGNDTAPSYSKPRSNRSSSLIDKHLKEANDLSPFSPGSNNVSLDMGQVFLMGNLGSSYADSIGLGLHYTYGVSELFAFESSMGYSNHSDGQFSMFSALAGLRTNLAWYDKVIPYLSFGLGFYRPSYTYASGATTATLTSPLSSSGTSLDNSMSPLLFGVHIGPGVDLELTRNIYFGGSITFHDMFGKTELTADNKLVDVGGTFTSFYLHAGMTF